MISRVKPPGTVSTRTGSLASPNPSPTPSAMVEGRAIGGMTVPARCAAAPSSAGTGSASGSSVGSRAGSAAIVRLASLPCPIAGPRPVTAVTKQTIVPEPRGSAAGRACVGLLRQDAGMPTHIALLRGINVGGRKRVAMADLRNVVTSLGHADVATYIQSGNVLFSSAEDDTARLAADLEQAIAGTLGVQAGVVVLTRDELASVARDNPYTSEPNPKAVHVVFLPADPDPDPDPEPGMAARLAQAQEQAAGKGSRDTVQLAGRAVFVHTPDGFGTSELVKLLGRAGGPMSSRGAGTARNWATVTKLLDLCD